MKRSFIVNWKKEDKAMTRIHCNQRRQRFRSEIDVVDKRKRQRGGLGSYAHFCAFRDGNGFHFYGNSKVVLLVTVVAFLLLLDPSSAAAWLSRKQSTSSGITAWNRNHLDPTCSRCSDCHQLSRGSRERDQRLFSTPRPQKSTEQKDSKRGDNTNTKELRFEDDISDDLDSLRAHAAKLRKEAESLQSAIRESKEAKLQRETEKVDGWIDELLIEVTLGDGTELLKTVDQVYDALKAKRFSAHHVLKIFDRLCDVREQESRSNCSPLMELLVDATGLLDCTEKENNPNKRWNYRVERVLRRKLFARDWNIDYVSEDEKSW